MSELKVKNIGLKIEEVLHKELKKLCIDKDMTMEKFVTELIKTSIESGKKK
jgi:hypothetical protein